MKMPNEPKQPRELWLEPLSPDEFIDRFKEVERVSVYDALPASEYARFTWDEFLTAITPVKVDPTKMLIEIDMPSDDGDGFVFRFGEMVKEKVPGYKTNLKRYQKEKAAYDKIKVEYETKMAEYQVKLAEYQEWERKNELKFLKKRIKELETGLPQK